VLARLEGSCCDIKAFGGGDLVGPEARAKLRIQGVDSRPAQNLPDFLQQLSVKSLSTPMNELETTANATQVCLTNELFLNLLQHLSLLSNSAPSRLAKSSGKNRINDKEET